MTAADGLYLHKAIKEEMGQLFKCSDRQPKTLAALLSIIESDGGEQSKGEV